MESERKKKDGLSKLRKQERQKTETELRGDKDIGHRERVGERETENKMDKDILRIKDG